MEEVVTSGLDLTDEDYWIQEMEAEAEEELLTQLDDKINKR